MQHYRELFTELLHHLQIWAQRQLGWIPKPTYELHNCERYHAVFADECHSILKLGGHFKLATRYLLLILLRSHWHRFF